MVAAACSQCIRNMPRTQAGGMKPAENTIEKRAPSLRARPEVNGGFLPMKFTPPLSHGTRIVEGFLACLQAVNEAQKIPPGSSGRGRRRFVRSSPSLWRGPGSRHRLSENERRKYQIVHSVMNAVRCPQPKSGAIGFQAVTQTTRTDPWRPGVHTAAAT